jgi:hypothetical protein
MDRAYQDDITRFTAWDSKFNPVVPPNKNRIRPWENDTDRAIGTKYDKLDPMFTVFIWLACICILLRSMNMP